MIALNACIAYISCMQYTVRDIPESLDEALRRKAEEEGKSLNEAAKDALARGLGIESGGLPVRELDDIAGTWVKDAAAEAAFAAQDVVDEDLWK